MFTDKCQNCFLCLFLGAYLFNSDEISMYFRSDGANAHRGFLIRGEQLKCKPKGQYPPKSK